MMLKDIEDLHQMKLISRTENHLKSDERCTSMLRVKGASVETGSDSFTVYPGLESLKLTPSSPLYSSEEIRQVHLELTDKCNAACPQCSRNQEGGAVNPLLPLTELSLEQIKTMFPETFLCQMKKIFICGNYGDPIQAHDILDIVRYFREANEDLTIGIHTNGGARTTAFWAALGLVLKAPKGYVRFAIDGLEKTNHLYRQHVVWSTLMDNVRAFIGAGGNAEWDYIVFRHNEHQVEEARQLSKDMGFTKFQAKATARFLDKRDGIKDRERLRPKTPVQNTNGQVVRHLEIPRSKKWQNQAQLKNLKHITKQYGSLQNYHDACQIVCKVQKSKEIYVSAEGYVFPCCWLHGQMYQMGTPEHKRQSVNLVKAAHPEVGLKAINLLYHPLSEVLESPFYTSLLTASWQSSLDQGRIKMCAQVCGSELDAFSSQFATKKAGGRAILYRARSSFKNNVCKVFKRFPVFNNQSSRRDADCMEPMRCVQPLAFQNSTIIFYATETGTAESLAHRLNNFLGDHVLVLNIVRFSQNLVEEVQKISGLIIFILSTSGNGSPTDDAQNFIKALRGNDFCKLVGLQFALYGLGSIFYQNFNGGGKLVLSLLSDRGAESICKPGWGDSSIGHSEVQFDDWCKQELLPSFERKDPQPNVMSKISLRELAQNESQSEERKIQSKLLTVISNTELRQSTVNGSTREIILECPEGFIYSTGDTIGVFTGPAPNARPRYYTCASSALAIPSQVRLVVTRVPGGLCSEWLCSLSPGSQVSCFTKPSAFSSIELPPKRPLLMVATGSGIAPFIGILEEMDYLLQAAENRQGEGDAFSSILFFGCRQRREDFLFRSKLEDWVESGVLAALKTAFSRENAHQKYYVQNELKENSNLIFKMALDSKMSIYVCGKAAMGLGIRNALQDIFSEQSFNSFEANTQYQEELW